MSAAVVIPLHEQTDSQKPLARSVPGANPEVLDVSRRFLGLGRSLTFPWTQWQDDDEYRTVFFDEGQGRTIVFVHGLGANATHWEHLAVPLVDRYRVVGLDLVGCGWTRKPDVPYGVELLRDHLIRFIERRGIRHAVLVGHSMGGAICLAAALKRPDLVEGLALVSAAGVGPLPGWMRWCGPWALRKEILLPFMVLGNRFILRNVFVSRPKENRYVKWFYESALRDAPGMPNLLDFARVSETLCRDLLDRDYSDRFHQIPVPVLALWGDADRLTYVSSVLRSLGGFRRLRTVVLRRCGHMPMVELPEETLFHIERFLNTPP